MKKPLTNAGDYNREFLYVPILYKVLQPAEPDWPNAVKNATVNYWGSLDEISGQQREERGTLRNISYAKIVLRQADIVISAEDRLIDTLFNNTYIIDSININWNANETVVMAHRYQNNSV